MVASGVKNWPLPIACGANGADESGRIGDDIALYVLCDRSRTDAERYSGLGIDPKICSLVPLLWLVSVGFLLNSEVDLGVSGGEGV